MKKGTTKNQMELMDRVQLDFAKELEKGIAGRLGLKTSVDIVIGLEREFLVAIWKNDYDYSKITLKYLTDMTIKEYVDTVEYFYNETDRFEHHRAGAIEKFVIDLLNDYDSELYVNSFSEIVDLNENFEYWCTLKYMEKVTYDSEEEILILEDSDSRYTIYLTEDRVEFEDLENQSTDMNNIQKFLDIANKFNKDLVYRLHDREVLRLNGLNNLSSMGI